MEAKAPGDRGRGRCRTATTNTPANKLSKETDQGAGGAEHEGEREGDSEEDVLVGDVGVEATFCLEISHFLTPTYITFYSRSTD